MRLLRIKYHFIFQAQKEVKMSNTDTVKGNTTAMSPDEIAKIILREGVLFAMYPFYHDERFEKQYNETPAYLITNEMQQKYEKLMRTKQKFEDFVQNYTLG